MRGVLDVCAIKSPGFGDRRRGYLEDVAVLTGATFITEQLGLSLDQVGTATAQPARPAPRTHRPRALPAARAARVPVRPIRQPGQPRQGKPTAANRQPPPTAAHRRPPPPTAARRRPLPPTAAHRRPPPPTASCPQATMEMLGKAERVSVSKERTTMISTGKHAAEVEERIVAIKAEKETTDSEFDREKCEERIAKLGGAIGRIKVGAATETELKDKKLRYEDALNSVKSAMNDGIVPGGGSTLVYLLRTKEKLTAMIDDEDEKLAVDILYRAMTYPIIQIAENAGSEGALVLEKVKDQKFGFGWNAATDSYEDLLETGVIDPSTVTMQAILNSCSIAASVLTTSALITEVPEEDPNGGMGGGMGDMM
jgi:chaperonin GroEL (HSP60 family)